MAFCANCGGKIEGGIKYCPSCGNSVGYISVAQTAAPAASVANVQDAVQIQSSRAYEKYCFSCGSIIKKEAEICPKCGVNQNSTNAKEQPLNGLAITSMILIFIGMVLYIGNRFLGLSSQSNRYGFIIGRLSWQGVQSLTLYGGVILALISLYKRKNKITLIAGIIGSAFSILLTLLYIIFRLY